MTSILDHSHGIRSSEISSALFDAYLGSGARIWFCYGLDDFDGSFPIADRVADFQELARDLRLDGSSVELGVAFDSWNMADEENLQSAITFIKFV